MAPVAIFWLMNQSAAITVGTTALPWVQFSASTSYSADGATLQLIGSQFSEKAGGTGNTQLTAGGANTYKGSLNGTSEADVAWPTTCTNGINYTAGTGPVCNAAATVDTADETTLHKSGSTFSELTNGTGNTQLAQMPAWRVKANLTSATANAADVPISGTSGATQVATATSAAKTSGHVASWDVNGNLVDGGVGGTGANPTATATDTAVNGSAATFMRSDAAPAVQKASSSVFGIVKVDGTTITASGGVISGTANVDTVTTSIAAAGTSSGTATSAPSQQNYVASGANCSTYPTCSGTAGVILASALMIQGNHACVKNEDLAKALTIYPPSGVSIDQLTANTPLFLNANTKVCFQMKTTTALSSS